jgi:preprotein translocase subunit SecA
MVTNVYNTLGADENMPIQMGLISRAVESAQKKVEGKHFSIRKHVLQFDDVMNIQREIIYKQRREVLNGENLKDKILNMMKSEAQSIILKHLSYSENMKDINKVSLINEIKNIFGIEKLDSLDENTINKEKLIEELTNKVEQNYNKKEKEIGKEELRELERIVMLKIVDEKWMNHIDQMDELKDGIGLRAYGQKDPVVQYRLEGFDMFDQMVEDIKTNVVTILSQIRKQEKVERKSTIKITNEGLRSNINEMNNLNQNSRPTINPIVNQDAKVGRNDSCPCGSGRKYKQCCGK